MCSYNKGIRVYTAIIYACYLAPENSPWGRDAVVFYYHLLSQLYLNGEADAIMLWGGFNSRIDKLNDYIGDLDCLLWRNCLDETINQHSVSLIEFWKNQNVVY